jgi:hypothetical protein
VRLLPSRLHQVSMRCEHRIVLSISKVEVIVLQQWDLSQLIPNYAYSFWDVRGDQSVLEVLWDAVAVNHAIQGWDYNMVRYTLHSPYLLDAYFAAQLWG